MKRLIALLCILVLLGACAAPAVVEEKITTTQPPTTTTMPREWPGVPQGYWAILAGSSGGHEEAYSFGYTLADINNDGVPELIIHSRWQSDEPVIALIYTLDGDEPVRLTGFNPIRSRGHIADDSTIYVAWYHWGMWTKSSYVLKPHATELTQLTAWSADDLAWVFDEEEPWNVEPDMLYFRGIGLDRQQITAKEFYTATAGYDPPPNPMQFDFIALG
jgi:hypothetical protein